MLVGRFVDERRDPIKATRAAAEYLRQAYNSLGAWPLAITSYNHGVGGVRSKVRKAGTSDLAAIIEDPRERYFGFASTNFYPEFLAAVEIFNDPQSYFPEVREEPPLQVAAYRLGKPVSASVLASRLGIEVEDLKEANYGLLDPVWSGRAAIPAGYSLKVPIAFADRADRLFGGGMPAQMPSAPAPRIVQVAARSVGSSNAAKRGESRVLEAKKSRAKESVPVRYVTVKSGDTVGSIASKSRISSDRLRSLNGIRGNKIVVGQRLRVS